MPFPVANYRHAREGETADDHKAGCQGTNTAGHFKPPQAGHSQLPPTSEHFKPPQTERIPTEDSYIDLLAAAKVDITNEEAVSQQTAPFLTNEDAGDCVQNDYSNVDTSSTNEEEPENIEQEGDGILGHTASHGVGQSSCIEH